MKKKMGIRGFTLIEVMIVVAIIAVISAVAYPSYQSYILRAHRTDAKAALSNAAQRMERFYTEKLTFNAASLGTATTDIAATTSLDKYYTIGFDTAPTSGTACSATATTSSVANAYRLCATPTGTQANDSCGIFSLDNSGIKLPTTAKCWD